MPEIAGVEGEVLPDVEDGAAGRLGHLGGREGFGRGHADPHRNLLGGRS